MTGARFHAPKDVGVAIVAPGGYAPDDAALARGIARMEALGCRVHNYYSPEGKYQRFGAPDTARIAQMHDAARNPDVQVVIALRGGYGMTRLLPHLDLALLAGCGKLFVGHSDFTALQMALLARSGTVTFAGPMVTDDFTREELSEFTMSHLWRCLTGERDEVTASAAGNPALDVEGTLWGGNLSMLAALLGTPYFPSVDGGVLFLEDVNEHPYRVERMLLQLDQAGVLARQQAVVLGDFSNYKLFDYDNGYDFAAMLAFMRSRVATPIVCGLPFGHMRDKVTLPVGCRARLVTDDQSLRLTLSSYPILR